MQLRATVWYFRRIVPSELRAIVGKKEILKRLSGDLREAKRLVAIEIVRSDQYFERARQIARTNAEFDAACLAAVTEMDAPFPGLSFSPVKSDVCLADLMQRFLEDLPPAKSAKTVAKRASHARLILQVLGAKTPIKSLKREDARLFLRTVKALPANWAQPSKAYAKKPISAATANAYLGSFTAAMQFAENEGLILKSPARGLRIEGDGIAAKDRRSPFSVADLQKIFETRHKAPSRYWIPLIGAFSGMRLGEICQLRADDFTVQDKINVILVRDDGDRHLKTASARRIVPVHGQLVRLGLLKYVQGLKPDQRLFPDLRESASGYLSDLVSQHFSTFLRRIGVAGSFHGFRHLVTDQLRDQLVPRDQIDALLGWTGKGMAETVYGKGLGAKVLAKAISNIKYDGLSLNHLCP